MTPHAIASMQMPIGQQNNIEAMKERLELTMHMYSWVQLVLFSKLAPFGTGRNLAQSMPGPVEAQFQAMAAQRNMSANDVTRPGCCEQEPDPPSFDEVESDDVHDR